VSCGADGSNADVAQAIFDTAIGLVAPTFTPDGAFNVSSTLAEALAQLLNFCLQLWHPVSHKKLLAPLSLTQRYIATPTVAGQLYHKL